MKVIAGVLLGKGGIVWNTIAFGFWGERFVFFNLALSLLPIAVYWPERTEGGRNRLISCSFEFYSETDCKMCRADFSVLGRKARLTMVKPFITA